MLPVQAIVGNEGEPRFAGRQRDVARIRLADAAKRRLRITTDGGADLALDLPRGAYLCHGSVLVDDGERIVVVERDPEDALVVRLDLSLPAAELLRQAARLGHALGNQHVPVEIEGNEIRTPITTSPEIAMATVAALGLAGAHASVELLPLARDAPMGAAGHMPDYRP